jgi:hypothetical protein
MKTSRRLFLGLLGGGAAAAVAGVAGLLPKAAPAFVSGMDLAAGPDMTALMVYRDRAFVGYMEGLSQRYAETIIYGDPSFEPMAFQGFISRYDSTFMAHETLTPALVRERFGEEA